MTYMKIKSYVSYIYYISVNDDKVVTTFTHHHITVTIEFNVTTLSITMCHVLIEKRLSYQIEWMYFALLLIGIKTNSSLL